MSTPNPFDFPIVVTADGLQPQDPVAIQTQLIAKVAADRPDYTSNLPGILIEDVSSTVVAAIVLGDQEKVEAVNSLTPNGANVALLTELGDIYGVPYGQQTNTSVPVVFSGTVGYVIPDGILVSDGTHTYRVPTGAPIGGGGVTPTLIAVAVDQGSFGVPANTVNRILTSIPSSVVATVNNPTAGTPGGAAESMSSYRTRVLQAGLAACVGGPRLIKTLVAAVAGVQKNLVSVVAVTGGLKVIAGGAGDVYQIAYAILKAVGDPTRVLGSVTTARNITVSLIDPPNTYNVVFVNPPVQVITLAITWNTTLSSFTGGGSFASLVQPGLVAYINSIAVGQPINILQVNDLFKKAVASVLPAEFLTRLVVAVTIDGTPTSPGAGTYIVSGDPEKYFTTALDGSGITVVQG